jgi:hypothetical protein
LVGALIACDNLDGGEVRRDGDSGPSGEQPPPLSSFLQPCENDDQCQSKSCIAFGSEKRCSRLCSAHVPCPQAGGWTCDRVCQCTPRGKITDTCGEDGDCDGVVDRLATDETCNGIDDDCNGIIDDMAPFSEGTTLNYRDADGDLFGDPNNQRWLCAPKDGWVKDARDCDDTRADVNPAEIEICGDALDSNCNLVLEDPEVCGFAPNPVTDIMGGSSSVLTSCVTTSIEPALDVVEIVGKQDTTHLKFTVRLAGRPATDSCKTYKLTFGSSSQDLQTIVYVYRPGAAACSGGLASVEVFLNGQPMTSRVATGFNAASPGHISFTIPKTELYANVPDPSYWMRACTNDKPDAVKDMTDCKVDSCSTPVHR